MKLRLPTFPVSLKSIFNSGRAGVLVCAAAGAACALDGSTDRSSETQADAFTSDKATLLDFAFEGEVVAERGASPEAAVQNQLYYTVGVLNGRDSVGRLDAVKIEILGVSDLGAKQTIRYRALLPVGWGGKYNLPSAFTMTVPRDVTYAGLSSFLAKYGETCIDLWSAHDVSVGNYWYYYRTEVRGCAPAPEDVTRLEARVTRSADNRDGTYPEYDKIWEDGVLHAIVIFGKDRAGASGFTDFGVSAYGQFNVKLRMYAAGLKLTPTPANIPGAPGTDFPDVTWEGTYPDGRRVKVNALLVDSLRSYNPAFDARYAELSPTADLIVYNGHAALGDNVKALTRKGRFVPGQYTIVSMMGCDSFAYVDGYMAAERARLNPDDPKGTKYLDMITNVTPANPTWFPAESADMIARLGDVARPSTYQQILRAWEPKHIAVVTGDEDNAYAPPQR